MSFGKRLDAAVDARGSVCVGIDPHPGLLEAWGLTDDSDGLARFADICVVAYSDSAAVVKPQSAFFETYGSRGIAVLERTVAALRAAGVIVLLDVKRGDIGTTMAAYARAYLDPSSPLVVDAITVSPYLGVGSLDPVFELCERFDAGAFVLALTSNKEGPQFQRAHVEDGREVAQVVVDELGARNADLAPLGSLGIVVGATIGSAGVSFDTLGGPILAPGVGAQGGNADSVRQIFGASMRRVLPSVSREVLQHGPDVAGLRSAVLQLNEEYAFMRA
jgi:orotidine-5'-phosphate decarboxylase